MFLRDNVRLCINHIFRMQHVLMSMSKAKDKMCSLAWSLRGSVQTILKAHTLSLVYLKSLSLSLSLSLSFLNRGISESVHIQFKSMRWNFFEFQLLFFFCLIL